MHLKYYAVGRILVMLQGGSVYSHYSQFTEWMEQYDPQCSPAYQSAMLTHLIFLGIYIKANSASTMLVRNSLYLSLGFES